MTGKYENGAKAEAGARGATLLKCCRGKIQELPYGNIEKGMYGVDEGARIEVRAAGGWAKGLERK